MHEQAGATRKHFLHKIRNEVYHTLVSLLLHTGKLTSKRAPPKADFPTETTPFIDSAACFTIASPKPVPPISRERDVSAR